MGTKTKLNILATHAMDAAKRLFGIADFRYYALADGIKAVFKDALVRGCCTQEDMINVLYVDNLVTLAYSFLF